ncbi:hypothetical protein [Geothrix alkalitolerans]|uniref:hypothetical protein n=1 Tax=Geothrix alkalitolerans TaxID=2922724 RepID=UPI001FAE9633|nr:hypothetical protein [Geothrix alkalitolerans]
MDRFGSSKLRIGWTLVCLFLAGLVFMAIRGQQGPDGSQVVVFGTAVPLGADSLKDYALGGLQGVMYWLVSLVVLLGAFGPVSQWTAAASRGERLKGFFAGTGLGFAHGLFLSQVALLPVWALSWRLIGQAWPPELLRADLHGLLLGLQMLLWAVLLSRLLKSSAGLALLLTLLLRELGPRLSFFLDFGQDLGWSAGQVKVLEIFVRLLPMAQLPSDPFSPLALPLSIGGPLVLGTLAMLLPAGGRK